MLFVQKWRNHTTDTKATYGSWLNMIARCTKPKHQLWEYYGGRGITVCDRWIADYDAFYDDMGPRPKGYTLERIDNSIGYSPENCRWASRKEQAQNRRSGVNLTINGVTKNIHDWLIDLNVDASSFYGRLRRGVPALEAMKPRRWKRNKTLQHGTNSMYSFSGCRCEACKIAGREYRDALKARKRSGDPTR